MDANLPRWIKSSIAKYLVDRCAPYTLYVDGQSLPDDLTVWAELYVVGPSRHQYSSKWTKYEVTVLIGCQIVLTNQDIYQIDSIKGIFQSILCECDIPVYRYGPKTDSINDESEVGMLQLRDDVHRPIDGLDYGVIGWKGIEVRRATVEAMFFMTPDESAVANSLASWDNLDDWGTLE